MKAELLLFTLLPLAEKVLFQWPVLCYFEQTSYSPVFQLCTSHLKPPQLLTPHWGIPGANQGFWPRFYSISRGIHLFSRLRYIECGGWAGGLAGQWCGATVTKDARSSGSLLIRQGDNRGQFHQEIGFATISIHLVSHTLSGGSALGAVLIKANL